MGSKFAFCHGIVEVGAACIIKHGIDDAKGVIRFVGTTHLGPGIWVGIELDLQKGRHDGTVDGITYFKTTARRGVFVRPDRVRGVAGFAGRQLRLPSGLSDTADDKSQLPSTVAVSRSNTTSRTITRAEYVVSSNDHATYPRLSRMSLANSSQVCSLGVYAVVTDVDVEKEIVVSSSRVSDVVKLLEKNRVTVVDLRGSGMNDDGARSLASALTKNTSLIRMNLSHGGAISLATVMGQNQRCVFIDLSGNLITAEGVLLIRTALHSINESILHTTAMKIPSLLHISANTVMFVLQTVRIELRAIPLPLELRQYLTRSGKTCPVCSRTFYNQARPRLVVAQDPSGMCRLTRLPVCGPVCVLSESSSTA